MWQELLSTSQDKRLHLQDAQKREHFVREADELAAWISAKRAVASSEELGKDLEHVQLLQSTFSDFLKDLQANEPGIISIDALAEQLLKERHPDVDVIHGRQEALRGAWHELSSLAHLREERLVGAHEIQHFHRCPISKLWL